MKGTGSASQYQPSASLSMTQDHLPVSLHQLQDGPGINTIYNSLDKLKLNKQLAKKLEKCYIVFCKIQDIKNLKL
jgi:hypothetical protein